MGINKFLTTIWNNKEVRLETTIIVTSAFCSALCAVLTQNMILTAFYIGITAIIDIISEIESEMEGLIDWECVIGKIFGIKNWIKYLIFVVASLIPTLWNIKFEENAFSWPKDIFSVFFLNIFPNLCGALIVCSLITHISNLGERQFVAALIQSKKGLINIFIRLIFFACCLNAINYKADDSWRTANILNSIYLFFIVFCGGIAVVSFLCRLVDNQPFPYTVKQAFPTGTLFLSAVFLFSCGAAPLIAKVGKHEPFLLLINTFTTIVLFGGILGFLSYNTNQHSKEYPMIESITFLVFTFLNCTINFLQWDGEGDIPSQIRSGLLVLGLAIISFLVLVYLKNKNSKTAKKEKSTSKVKVRAVAGNGKSAGSINKITKRK